jgi:uncharacterized protein (TIGR02145 family)
MKPTIKLIGLILLGLYFSSCRENPNPPIISTKDVTEITATTAVSGGTILDDGGDAAITNGVCWNTSDEPTIDNNKTVESGGNSYVSNISKLSPSTTYYVRAYATNSGGTSYGSSVLFTTLGDEPVITESSVINLGMNTATLSCTVNPNYLNTTVTFEWGITTSYGNTASASQNPLSAGNALNVSADITGLESEATYNFRIKAENDLGTAYSDNMTFKTYAAVDGDGKGYYSVTIGTQTWLTENLKTTKYNDGTDIQCVTDSIAWAALMSGAYCNYKNSTDSTFINTYGRLYNWYAVNTGKLAPVGWHVPTSNDFQILSSYLGNGNVAGGKMKESGTTHWNSPNTGATNESGFTALPSGGRLDIYSMSRYEYKNLGANSYFWISSSGFLVLTYQEAISYYTSYSKKFGLSVRLIKG